MTLCRTAEKFAVDFACSLTAIKLRITFMKLSIIIVIIVVIGVLIGVICILGIVIRIIVHIVGTENPKPVIESP